MSLAPEALPAGTLLTGRFEIERVLGRGGFGIAYLASDIVRGDKAVVKELAPTGTVRSADGLINLDDGHPSSQRLRQSFVEEARHLSRLSFPGVLPVRAVFTENGTAYYATDYVSGSTTLEKLLIQEGRLDQEGALDILYQLLETLEQVHRKGILHRDIKPNNILLTEKGQAYLIDFGAAREWHADAATTHTVLYTPGYAPLEQLSERGRRGPATDIYALCATAYRMLTGTIPLPAADRASGIDISPLRSLRPDLELSIATAIEAGLQVKYHERPQSVSELRELLSESHQAEERDELSLFDSKLVQLQNFTFERRQCPACKGVLEQAKPLRRWGCPVCREGTVRKRDLPDRLCPECRVGLLHRRQNDKPIAFCPICRIGQLSTRRQGLIKAKVYLDCGACSAILESNEGGLLLLSPEDHEMSGKTLTGQEWRTLSGRSAVVHICDSCSAQYDSMEDGRWAQVNPKPTKFAALYPEEWSRVAANLPPNAGNAACDLCRADFYLEGENITLLTTEIDPHGFAAEHLGRLLNLEDIRWLGVGKDSPAPGLVCVDCGTEMDLDGDYLRVIKSPNRQLLKHAGEPKKLVDLHRIASGLPELHEEAQFKQLFLQKIVEAYESGRIAFDAKNDTLWKGVAHKDDQSGTLVITPDELSFGGMLRKLRMPVDAIVRVSGRGDVLEIQPSGETAPTQFKVTPVELTIHLESGKHSVLLTAENLANRLARLSR